MIRGVLLGAAAGVVIWGNIRFHYLSDDAYIAFRYARNAAEGLGFVYNPPPFAPVEGYSSFAWVAMLALIQLASGVDAETATPVLSLGFALATLGVLHLLVRDTRMLGIVLLGTVTNRTWLHWTTGGLETPLWTFALLCWVTLAVRRHYVGLFVVAALLPLVRPDGYLLALLTPGLFLLARRSPSRNELVALGMYALPLVHLLWRFSTYGFWLPNTYYAKVIRPWPSMGAVYLGTFAYEYMLFPLLLLALWAGWRRGVPPMVLGVVAILGSQLATHLWWGGDHFEYRILVHWIPLIWVAAARALPLRKTVFYGLIATWAAGMFIPWAHFFKHDHLHFGISHDEVSAPLTDQLPGVFWPWIYPWERAQNKMQYHLVGIRHHLLRRFIEGQKVWYADLSPVPPGGNHLFPVGNPGYPGWVLPQVAILDTLGLNDAVVAHQPIPPIEKKRRMAHDRFAPPGYVDCFEPDLKLTFVEDEVVGVRHNGHARPTDGALVHRCQLEWWTRVGIERRLRSR